MQRKFLAVIVCSSLLMCLVSGRAFPKDSTSRFNTYAHFMQGVIEKSRGDFKSAEQHFKQALEGAPDQTVIMKELASVAMHRNKIDEAIHWGNEVLRQDPDDTGTMILLARIYAQERNIPRSIDLLERVLEKDPENREALFYLGSLYMEIKDYDRAIEVLERSLQKETQHSFMIHYYLGRLYLDAGKLNAAEQHFKRALELNSRVVNAFYGLAKVYGKENKVRDAVSAYRAYLNGRPSDIKVHDEFIRFLMEHDLVEEAATEVERFWQKAPQDPGVGLRATGYLLDLGHYEKALELVERLQHFYPASTELYFLKAMAFEGLGKKKEALEGYARIGPNDPMYIMARLRMSRIYRSEKDYDKALEILKDAAFDESIPHKRQINDLFLDLALLLDEMGRTQEALETAQKILDRDPEDPLALNFIGYTYAEMGIKLDEAERLIKKALKKRPDDGYILDSLGWVYFKKNRYTKAIDILEKALKVVPDDPIINEHLGDAYFFNGDYEDARDQYERSLRLFKDKEDRQRLEEKRDRAQEAAWELMPF